MPNKKNRTPERYAPNIPTKFFAGIFGCEE